jgi:hypothetical protein
MQLFYFTSSQYALSNLAMRRLKVSRFLELNDPFELMAANLSDDDERRAMQGFHDQIDATKGVICFSSRWDNPVLWGHYADKHRGIALSFEVPDYLLFQARYENSRFFLPRDPKTNRFKPDEATIQRILSTKFTDWKYESEWRYFVDLSEAKFEAGLYYEDFSESLKLTEVILGAKCEISKEKVQSLIDALGLSAEVKKAKIALDEFRVFSEDEL